MGAARLAALLLLGLGGWGAACGADRPSLILAATTSTYDSGLLDSLMTRFSRARPDLAVRTIVVGSGEALELGRRGDVDALLVHAPEAERRFEAAGHAAFRAPVMSNRFVIVGPPDDPAGIRGTRDPADAFRRLAARRAAFVSRGDSSGTHERELALWRDAGAEPAGDWYVESGQGQGTTLQIASEREAYTIADEATVRVLSRILDLVPLVVDHPSLVNPYSVIVPVRARHPEAAAAFADWLVSPAGARAIRAFRRPADSVPLFVPAGDPDG